MACGKDVTPTASTTPTPSPPSVASPSPTPSPEVASVVPYPLPEDEEILKAPAPGSEVPAGTRRESILSASERGLAEYQINGTGDSSGEAMTVAVQNTSGSPLEIVITPGTVFLPNGNAQQMMAWGIVAVVVDSDSEPQRVSTMYLPDATPRLAVVEAYCLNFELPNPERTDVFTVSATPQISAAAIVYAAKTEKLSLASTQIAVWKNQDDHITQKEIESKFEASQEEFDKAFELVKRVHETRKHRAALSGSPSKVTPRLPRLKFNEAYPA